MKLRILSVALAAVMSSAPPFEGPGRAAAVSAIGAAPQANPASVADQVRDVERAFARTMADRDHARFMSFLADETVFMPEGQKLRGTAAVAASWKRFFDGLQAPFSWEPDRAEVLESGTLALTSGPVRDPQGNRIGTFNSVWRREAGGRGRPCLTRDAPAATAWAQSRSGDWMIW